MKKIISLLMSAVMLLSIVAVSSSAAGELIFSDNFDNGFARRNWYTDPAGCAFKWDSDNKCIQGYRDAVVLQSEYGEKYDRKWDKFYASFDVQIRGFDELPDEDVGDHTITFWYHDLFEQANIGEADGAVYGFNITIETGEVSLNKNHSFKYTDEHGITQQGNINNNIASGKVDYTIEVGEDAEWFNVGIRVTDGKIECFFNKELVLSSSVADGTEKIGDSFVDAVDATVGSQKSAVLFFNDTCWLALDNFEVWTPDYWDPETGFVSDIPYGDVNNDDKINMMDATKLLQHIAGWQVQDFVEANADTTGDGKVNLSDVTRLLQHIAGWDVVLGPVAE